MSQVTTAEAIERVIGREIEIPCRKMEIILRTRSHLDEPPPLFAGPGVIRSDKGGDITFEIFDQLRRAPEDTMQTISLLRAVENPFVVEAESYDGVSWLGGWHKPEVTWHETGHPTVRGSFHQLTTDFPPGISDPPEGTTELHYPSQLRLPMSKLIEQHTVREGNVENKAAWRDRHELVFSGALVVFQHLEEPERTIVRVKNRDKLGYATAEAWIDEALSFMLGWHVHHRVAVRYAAKRSPFFIRKCVVQERTGMPTPVNLDMQRESFWTIFERYLAHCEKKDCFAPPCELSHVWSEVLLASTGTVHSFVFALVAAIESLARQIDLKVPGSSTEQIDQLRKHVEAWSGDADVKNRGLGLLSQLKSVSMAAIFKVLERQAVVTAKQIEIWRTLRNKLAHGGILDYYHRTCPLGVTLSSIRHIASLFDRLDTKARYGATNNGKPYLSSGTRAVCEGRARDQLGSRPIFEPSGFFDEARAVTSGSLERALRFELSSMCV